ncbi:MAG: hypothetical protein ACKVP4_01870 [Hyphomicrobium sp.]
MTDGPPVYFLGQIREQPSVPTRDVLNYIADMLSELGAMAQMQRCDSLAAMLALTSEEARRQADLNKSRPK